MGADCSSVSRHGGITGTDFTSHHKQPEDWMKSMEQELPDGRQHGAQDCDPSEKEKQARPQDNTEVSVKEGTEIRALGGSGGGVCRTGW